MLNKKFQKMETVEKQVNVKELQYRIFRIADGIRPTSEAKEDFLRIMAIRMGREHKVYQDFAEIVSDPQQQLKLLNATDTHKYKGDFRVFCHIVLKNYVGKTSEKAKEKDILLQNYFKELEKCSQKKPCLFALEEIKDRFATLRNLEYCIIRRILGEEGEASATADFTASDYRQLLTAWVMYPELWYASKEISEIVFLFETKKLDI